MVPSVSPTPVVTTPAVKTSIGADGEEEKTAEDATSVTKVKKVKKKAEAESTITVDEDESEERVID
jgi:hypothetical protein